MTTVLLANATVASASTRVSVAGPSKAHPARAATPPARVAPRPSNSSCAFLARTLAELYGAAEPPPSATTAKLAFPASAQFAASRNAIRKRPRAFYARAYNLSTAATPETCRGRTCGGYFFEQQYHYIFGRAWDFDDGVRVDYARWKLRVEP